MKLTMVLAVGLLAASSLAAAGPGPWPEDFQPTAEVLIPAGEFTMGRAGGDEGYEPHQVRLSAFFIDVHEVTNAQWLAFCTATGRKLPVFWGLDRFHCGADWPDHPVVGVTHGEARAYAAWVGRRLPTEAEWEYAARGGLDGLRFDVADTLGDGQANTKAAGLDGTTPVRSFAPNGYGLYDMVGNVREWVWDLYSDTYFRESPPENPQGPARSKWRVVKGGGWFSGKGCNAVSERNALPQSWRDFNVGFRCARDAEPADER